MRLYRRDMRIVISGTHASGKSTLVSDFVLRHPEFAVLPDPFELLNESWDGPTASSFSAHLRVAADRLDPREASADFITQVKSKKRLCGSCTTTQIMSW